MITVLAENWHDRNIRAVIDLPAQEGKIEEFRKTLGAELDCDILIRYAGTGEFWSTDTLLLENNLKQNPTTIGELNLLAYLLDRMDENCLTKYDDTMSEYTNDLGTAGIKSLINEAYDSHAQATGYDESLRYYDGDNIDECINAERIMLKSYPEMSVDVFWKMIEDAREVCDDDHVEMENHLINELSRMSPHDIRLYKDINDEYINLAGTEEICEAAAELNGGISDDGFIDFRGWMISQGKAIYMNALKNPASLAKLKPINHYFEWETFNYIAYRAYEINTGNKDLYEMPSVITVGQLEEITGCPLLSGIIRSPMLYSPVSVSLCVNGEADECIYNNASEYVVKLRDGVNAFSNERYPTNNLMQYFRHNDKAMEQSIKEKVTVACPTVISVQGAVYGVLRLEMTADLADEELEAFKDGIEEQYRDGWGAELELHEIPDYKTHGFLIRFYPDGEPFYLNTEEEMIAGDIFSKLNSDNNQTSGNFEQTMQ